MRKIGFILISSVFIWACGGPYHYDLYVKAPKHQISTGIQKVLFVDNIESGEEFWHQGIAYRVTPYRVKYLTSGRWVKRPGELIKDSVIRFFRNSGVFKKVINEYSDIEPDIKMKIYIDALEMLHQKKKWFAHLAMNVEISDAKSDKVIFIYSFDRKEKLKGRKARYLPEKISEILQEELVKIVKKLSP